MNDISRRNECASDDRAQSVKLPVGFGESSDDILRRAYRSYTDEHGASQALTADKRALLQQYDVPGMETAVAICFWGRSGSFLLASYFDGHDDIVMLPMITGEAIYPFFHEYESLSVWEKLVAYPSYSEVKKGSEGVFFKGDYAIAAVDYYAAIHALFDAYGDRPAEWVDVRQRFFQFVHVAYAVAIGQRSGNPRPLMIYAQHWVNEGLAARFVEDFPKARFIHTIRDPITAVDSWFDRVVDMQMYGAGERPDRASQYLSPAVETIRHLLKWDRPHQGMEARTRAIRFEDLHVVPEATMRRLAEWLGIPYRPCLVESTWNGTPYVVQIRGVPSCGPNPANSLRRSKNLDLADRLMMFALLHDNFIAWNYPYPRAMQRRWIRLCVIALLWIIPMKMEMVTAQMVMRLQALPALRNRRLSVACGAPFFLLVRRLRMMLLIAAEARARLAGKRHVLEPL